MIGTDALADLLPPALHIDPDMEDDDLSLYESPSWDSGSLTPGQSAFERQKASLQTFLDWLPYQCESVEDMQSMLEHIVSRITICAETKNWFTLTTWDGILQWFVPPALHPRQSLNILQLAPLALSHV